MRSKISKDHPDKDQSNNGKRLGHMSPKNAHKMVIYGSDKDFNKNLPIIHKFLISIVGVLLSDVSANGANSVEHKKLNSHLFYLTLLIRICLYINGAGSFYMDIYNLHLTLNW